MKVRGNENYNLYIGKHTLVEKLDGNKHQPVAYVKYLYNYLV